MSKTIDLAAIQAALSEAQDALRELEEWADSVNSSNLKNPDIAMAVMSVDCAEALVSIEGIEKTLTLLSNRDEYYGARERKESYSDYKDD